MAQGNEEPPFLTVGTEVSAKYRGAFCEASIKTIKKLVKCKIQYKNNTTATVNDDGVKGALKVGSEVEVKNPDGQFMDGVITKLTDASVYTVVFDDGDERTLRRTSLCLKGERHFNESETLDHLPLTDPENFGTPVVQNGKKRKKRRISQLNLSVDESDNEAEQPAVPSKKKCLFNDSIVGKVVVVERGTKRKSHWFPALGVSPSEENMEFLRSKDQCLARSFKDGNYHVINIKDTKEFSKDQEPVSTAIKTENRVSKAAIDRAIAYIETGRIPSIWEGNKSEVITHDTREEDTSKVHSKLEKQQSVDESESEEEESEEKKEFVAKLHAFMGKRGTPITRPPILGNQDLDLHKLYSLVQGFGGMEEATNQQQWRTIYSKMGIAIMPPSASHHIKMAYKKYLYPYEESQLGSSSSEKESEEEKVEPLQPLRESRRSKSVGKLDKPATPDKPAQDKQGKQAKPETPTSESKVMPKKPDKLLIPGRASPSGKSSSRATTPNKTTPSRTTKSTPNKPNTGKSSSKPSTPNKPPTPESSDELVIEANDDVNDTRGKTSNKQESNKDYNPEDSMDSEIEVDEEVTSPESELAVDVVNSPDAVSDISEARSDTRSEPGPEDLGEFNIGDKIQVKYGRGRNQRIYEAKIMSLDQNAEEGLLFLIHYAGWNIRYDEWISPDRVVGKSSKPSRKKGTFLVRGQEVARSTLPPKPLGKHFHKSSAKRNTKTPPPVNGSGKTTKVTVVKENGTKNPKRANSPQLPAGNSPTTGVVARRTRSERNSLPEIANGIDEGVKSPPTRRQPRSATPEPMDVSDLGQDTSAVNDTSEDQPSSENKMVKSFDQAFEGHEDSPKAKKTVKEEIKDIKEETNLDSPINNENELENEESEKAKEQITPQGTRKKSRRVLNGLARSLSSPAAINHDTTIEDDIEDTPPMKKLKLEKEKELENFKIEVLLKEDVPGKMPVPAPHSEGRSSAENEELCEVDGKERTQEAQQDGEEKEKSQSESDQSKTSKSPTGSTSSKSDSETKDKPEKHDGKSDKKEPEGRHRRHKKKREKKKQRHHSGNESASSDVPASPGMVAHSPASRPSPSRPRINFDMELGMIKAQEDSSERIRLLQEKIKEMRKVYGSLKAEVASIDRRRKRLKKKREEHAAEASVHEGSSKASSTSSCMSPGPTPVECR